MALSFETKTPKASAGAGTGVPGMHAPPPQVSPVVQAFPSSQAFELLAKTQPDAGLQQSVVHTLLSLQTVAEPGVHTPPLQESPVVQAFPSSHAVPSGLLWQMLQAGRPGLLVG